MHAKRVCKYFELKKLGQYFYLKVILADVCKNFRKIYLQIYHLDLIKFFQDPGLVSQTALKNTEVKVELLTDTYMVLMVGKGSRG